MIKVELIPHTNVDPLVLATHAGRTCYTSEMPKIEEVTDFGVKRKLFDVGHHTTLQHFYVTFAIEGISVGDITFGFHLPSPFYNSDQRSGRYSKMFDNTGFDEIEEYIKEFWPEVSEKKFKEIMEYVKKGSEIYGNNIEKATEIAREFLKTERPMMPEDVLEKTKKGKIAQEQLRMFIPLITPTAFDFTINLSALAAFYRTAWTPAMKDVMEKMKIQVLNKFPMLEFMFREEDKSQEEWCTLFKEKKIGLKYSPKLKLLSISNENFSVPEFSDLNPVDKLHFLPEFMENSVGEIKTQIEISLATMGQDQRHRTIRRSAPEFTGNFYMPPILKKMKLEKEALEYMQLWQKVSKNIPGTLAMILAPYGAMVTYKKIGSFNAFAHEQAKRLCWNAQEEIYHLGRFLRIIIGKKFGKKSKFLRMLESPCYRTGRCAEGGGYCGRDIKLRKAGDYFPKRSV
jgi:thymidylate synthase ThyX